MTVSREFIVQLNCEYLANPSDGHLSQIHLDGKEGLDRKVLGCRAPTVKATSVRPCRGHLWMIRRRPGGAGPGENESGWAGSFRGPQLPVVGKFSNVAVHTRLVISIIMVRYD